MLGPVSALKSVERKKSAGPRPSKTAKRSSSPQTATPMSERILEGAARAFGTLGYAAVRVEDILLETGISRPTFYKTFGTKEEVFQALSERHHREIRELIRQVPQQRI